MNYLSILIMSIFYSATYSFPSGDQSGVPASAVIIAPLDNIGEIKNQKIANFINSKAFTIVPPFPDSGRKQAVLEHESLTSKADTAYGTLQHFVASFYNPKPVVDTIQEHEKYGNDGGKARIASIAVIGAVEGFSNALNAIVDIPFETARQISKKIGTTLGPVGALFAGRR